MSVLLVPLLSLAAVSAISGCDVNAPLRNIDSPLDMSQFKGTWYETITSTDQISSGHACCTFKDVKVNPTGFQALITFYYDHADPRFFNVDYKRTQRGTYKQKTVDENEVESKEVDENGQLVSQAARIYKDMEWNEFNMVGIENIYIAYVQCTPEGWIIWIGTREKVLTTEQLLFIRNDLLKRGVSSPLRLGRCQNIEDK